MPAYKTGKRTQQYSVEFKVKAVTWSHLPHRSVKEVAQALDIHPFMLSRWRKEYRDGKWGMSKKTKKQPEQLSKSDEISQLKRRLAELELENDLPKKVATVSSRGTEESFRFIARYQGTIRLSKLCQFVGVSRSGFYAWKKRQPSQRAQSDQALGAEIQRLFRLSKERYGSPRIHAQLKQQGISVARKRVARLMHELGLRARSVRVYRQMNKRRQTLKATENLRLTSDAPTAVNQQWSGDVTYLKHGRKWYYLAVIIDLYSRKIVGWSFSDNRTSKLTEGALVKALRTRRPKAGLLFHSDRGIEYLNENLQGYYKRHGIRHSLNRAGCCTDNAEVESFFHTLKGEMFQGARFRDHWKLRDELANYIDQFYNRRRLHSSLGYQSPQQFEKLAV
ncbi:IS3 family transposase [Ferrimonas sediminicola]|uniref:IS3 family transposase n=1 Tax=Ferrimonas sediminicola TaxID=2569538 RepID=UPI003898DD81